jgi:hypothetical protein
LDNKTTIKRKKKKQLFYFVDDALSPLVVSRSLCTTIPRVIKSGISTANHGPSYSKYLKKESIFI